ncbi:MAG: hypothetical protein IT458_06945 [Planctomycetes bacterium]|nr:hypothetical protein [Planctomycetota bacterium]
MRALAIAMLLAGGLAAQATVRTIYNTGPTANRYDIVVLGDGYTAAEQATFDANCQALLQAVLQKEPYKTFANYFNVHTVFRASRESGADHPDANPPIVRDTVYDATYNYGGTDRCLYIKNTSAALADAALAPANEGRILVMVNDPRYGGCASTFSVSYNGTSMTEVQIHEMGHSLGGLADEYDYPNQTYTGGEPGTKNITAERTGAKWAHWHGFDGIAAFEGAGYYRFGLFRPRINCLMRALGTYLCAVCQEQHVLRKYQVVNPIDQPQPAATVLTLNRPASQEFSFGWIAPASSNGLATWRVDGQVVAQGVGVNRHTLQSTAVATGRHTVSVEFQDRTPLVRQDPSSLLRRTRTWTVDVLDPTLADLTVVSVQPSLGSVAQGGSVDGVAVLRNAGPVAAGPFRVEWFLSNDAGITPQDVYLGGVDYPGLPAATQVNVPRAAMRVPMFAQAGPWYLGVLLDRLNQVPEANEGNNGGSAAIGVTTGPCTPTLEFRDPLVYPKDAAALTLATGGLSLPSVTARCAPGQRFLLLWGCSGSAPGTQLPGGPLLPLNYDACTSSCLTMLNGPIFANFFGTLDASGNGQAFFNLPPVIGPAWTTHFAAALYDPGSARFTAVTNAVVLQLRL